MIVLCLLLILASIRAEVLESTEDTEQKQNVTSLYPVSNKTDLYTHANSSENESEHRTVKEKSKTDATTWKLEAAYAETNLDKDKDGNTTNPEEEAREAKKNDSKEFKPSQPLGSFFNEEALTARGKESYESFTQVFKQPASSIASLPKEEYYTTYGEPSTEVHHQIQQPYTTEFPYKFEKTIYTRVKDNWPPDLLETKPTVEVPVKIPCYYEHPEFHGNHELPGLPENPTDQGDSGFHNHAIYMHEMPGIHSTQAHQNLPEPYGHINYGSHAYNIPSDSGISGMHPMTEVHKVPGWYGSSEPHLVPSVSGMPAGGLYKLPDPFKPEVGDVSTRGYGWAVNGDAVENHMKKRENPMKNLLRLITAFLPVGLIISALTPSVITIHSTDNGNQQGSNVFRRADTGISDIAPISERCRRRLLCELQSDDNYDSGPQKRKRKHCYKIYCEDTQALWRLLHWLLARHKTKTQDHRARDST